MTKRDTHTSKPPPQRWATVRSDITALLEEGPATAREISGAVGVAEKEVCDHLLHIRRSFHTAGHTTDDGSPKTFHVTPAECPGCGFIFKKRERLTKPGRCPICHATNVGPPVFSIRSIVK